MNNGTTNIAFVKRSQFIRIIALTPVIVENRGKGKGYGVQEEL